ncbi:MAG: 3-hydroxyacyl-CoA dehydrogenase/enoyl-CoA hydratase family protein [Legionellales bacterium]|nr:3-hydroxyacyl-CoA dehydrogenase/enoyl-CoA hydratase family protein [Legionellales bacterium]
MTGTIAVRKAAVLGAGVMGAQIAALLTNANVETILFDLADEKNADVSHIAKSAIKRLTQLKPAPLAETAKAQYLIPANYKTDLALLKDCDLIIEAIAERMDWKVELYEHIADYLHDNAIIASNTSGLNINQLSDALPKKLRSRFCGIHFFNPPRYMKLVEITPSAKTDPTMLPNLETFLVTTLGKGVIYAKDTPNFIANRIGVFSFLATLHHAEQFNIPFEVVDELTGTKIGRAKSATYRTLDVVGLDVMAHVVKTMFDQLPDDPWHRYFQLPDWLMQLIEKGALGQKAGAGIYRKQGKVIQVFNPKTQDYQAAQATVDAGVLELLKIKQPAERFAKLRQSSHPQAQFLWAIFRDLFHYTAYHLTDIAENVRDVDLAIRWGFGWKQGPFEIWQSAGFQEIFQAIEQNIQQEKAMAVVSLPEWVNRNEVYSAVGAFSPKHNQFQSRSDLPVYQRQYFPEPVLNEVFNEGHTIFENEGLRLWHFADHNIAIASFKTKMNTVSMAVLDGLQEAIRIAEQDFAGLVLWQRQGEHFSAGADLSGAVSAMQAGRFNDVEQLVAKFQETSMMLRYSRIPTVAAVRGYVFGGGCELTMHCDHAVAAFESYIGLVEAGVGLLPAGGGCKEFALRAHHLATRYGDEPFHYLQHYFKNIAMAEVAGSAIEAKTKFYLREQDTIVMNSDEILFVAIQQAQALAAAGYRPPLPTRIQVAGKAGIATLHMLLVNYREGGFISDHDFHIGLNIANVMCGGDIEANSLVDEAWLLRLERELFVALAQTEKTQARIAHMLQTGKPLRN